MDAQPVAQLVFRPSVIVSVRSHTLTAARLVFLRVLGLEDYIARLEARVKSLEDAIYNQDDAHLEFIREVESHPSRLMPEERKADAPPAASSPRGNQKR